MGPSRARGAPGHQEASGEQAVASCFVCGRLGPPPSPAARRGPTRKILHQLLSKCPGGAPFRGVGCASHSRPANATGASPPCPSLRTLRPPPARPLAGRTACVPIISTGTCERRTSRCCTRGRAPAFCVARTAPPVSCMLSKATRAPRCPCWRSSRRAQAPALAAPSVESTTAALAPRRRGQSAAACAAPSLPAAGAPRLARAPRDAGDRVEGGPVPARVRAGSRLRRRL